jgi:hypothetical protein
MKYSDIVWHYSEPESVRAARAEQARAAAVAKAKAKSDETNRIAAERRAAAKAEQAAAAAGATSARSTDEEKAPPGPLDATAPHSKRWTPV